MKKIGIYSAAVCLLLLLSPAAMASRKLISESESSIAESHFPHDTENIEELLITIRDGLICAVDADGDICFRTDISANNLTAADRLLLKQGIRVRDYLEMIALLENYNS